MKAVFIEQPGGADALRYADIPTPKPAPGEILVKIAYAGVNFIDTYHRSGLYKLPLPAVIGSEASGKVDQLGEGVTQFKVGDRVVYTLARGSYAEYHAVPATQAVKVPDNIDDATAAACILQGATAHYLTHSTFPLKRGQTTLIHAAAGGTGRLLVQIATMIGARVIGTVGSEEKAKLAKSDGASETILYNQVDFVAETKRLTDGKGVEVIYDGVGKATLLKGLDCLMPRGMMVAFGNASGPADPVDLLLLSQKGSLYVTRPTLFNYIASREDLEWRMSDLFRWIGEGKLKINIDKAYPLADAAQAHRDLEGRKTTGKLLLKVA